MKKKTNKIISIVGVLVILLFAYYIKDFIYMYRTDFGINKDYLWLFKDSIVADMDTISSYTDYRKTDKLCLYHWATGIDLNKFENKGITYHSDITGTQYFNISVWDIYSLQDMQPENIQINYSVNLNNVNIRNHNTLDYGSVQPTIIRLTKVFMNGLSIDVDNTSEIDTIHCTSKYKGFYCTAKRILLKDKDNTPQAILNFQSANEPVLLIAYKSKAGLLLILFTSAKKFDDNILSILDFHN